MLRRDFLLTATAIGGGALLRPTGAPEALLAQASGTVGPVLPRAARAPLAAAGGPLYRPPVVSPTNLILTAREATAEVAPGVRSPVFTLGDGPAAPTIRARVGDRATITLKNALSEPTILHWHGLRPPEEADGHPRLAIAPGAEYRYDFPLADRAGTYWYHPHPHMRTAAQVHGGMAGLLILTDSAEEALGLPSGEREIGILLQDKRPDAKGQLSYSAEGHDMMEGWLGSTCYANGVRTPEVAVDSALYRVRLVGGANARIFRLALSNNRPLVLIGTDGGLLDAPITLPHMDLATGERADLLLDFSGLPVGTRVTLESIAFKSPYGGMGMGMGMGMGGNRAVAEGEAPPVVPQGGAMPLLEFVVSRSVQEANTIPTRLSTISAVRDPAPTRTREFVFRSSMMQHTINGRGFDMDRIDEVVPFGATERWEFVNEGPFPHPVHMHAVVFRVVSRTGGRDELMPWEGGIKDTVLVYPGERVSVVATFDSHRGRFLMHCHNLEHEDHGMMMNYAIE